MPSRDEGDAKSELIARLDWLIASLDNPVLIVAEGGWTEELASRYADGLRSFRQRVVDGTTTEQDETMSWARALDFEGVGYGDAWRLAARVDDARRTYFEESSH